VATTRVARARLPSDVFDLPVAKMRDVHYSDAYFVFTKTTLEAEAHRPRVVMQVRADPGRLRGPRRRGDRGLDRRPGLVVGRSRLIAAYGADTALAAERFAATHPDLDIVVLVGFENDSGGTAVEVARTLGPRL
jgi:hypothetical protein